MPAIPLREAFLVFVAALLVIVALYLVRDTRSVYSDSATYSRITENLISHGSYSLAEDGSLPTTMRLPGYPLFLYPFMRWIPDWESAVVAVQMLLFAAVVLFVFVAARRFLRRPFAHLAAALLLADLWFMKYAIAVMSDIPSVFFLCASGMFVLYYRGRAEALPAGICFAVAVLIRPASFAMSPILLLLIANRTIFPANGPLRVRLMAFCRYGIVLVLPLALSLGLWVARNARAVGSPVLTNFTAFSEVSTLTRLQRQGAPNQGAWQEFYNRKFDEYLARHPEQVNPRTLRRCLVRATGSDASIVWFGIFENPLIESDEFNAMILKEVDPALAGYFPLRVRLMLRNVARSLFREWKADADMGDESRSAPGKKVWTLIHSFLLLGGVFCSLFRKRGWAYALFIGVLMYLGAVGWQVFYETRYMFPALPVLAFLSASGYEWLISRTKSFLPGKTQRPLTAS